MSVENETQVQANSTSVPTEQKKVTREEAARKGGRAVSRDRSHMAEIGRRGGQAVSRNREHMAAIGRKGGEAVSRDREHMAQIGQKGGERRGLARKGASAVPNSAAPLLDSKQRNNEGQDDHSKAS